MGLGETTHEVLNLMIRQGLVGTHSLSGFLRRAVVGVAGSLFRSGFEMLLFGVGGRRCDRPFVPVHNVLLKSTYHLEKKIIGGVSIPLVRLSNSLAACPPSPGTKELFSRNAKNLGARVW